MGSIRIDLSAANEAREDREFFRDWRTEHDIPHDPFWNKVVGDWFLPAVRHGHEHRFLVDHPKIGPVLRDWWDTRQLLTPPPGPPVVSSPPAGSPVSPPGAVPEPSSVVLLGIAIVAAAILKSRR